MVSKQRKGQAALEFLTTYGWAFMVILVMIGALAYFGVLNPTQLIPDSCSVTSGFTCDEYQVDTGGQRVDIRLINNMGRSIEIDNTTVDVTMVGDSIGDCEVDPSGTAIADGARFDIICTGLTLEDIGVTPGSKARMAFSFDHRRAGGEFYSLASGTLTATAR